MFLIQREIMISYLFRKLTKVLTNNLKIDFNGISDLSKMCKNIIFAEILIYQPIRSFMPCCLKTGSRSITQFLR